MQNILLEKPYKFIPPYTGTFWPTVMRLFNMPGRYLKSREGVVAVECRHVERLKASLAAGHGILLAPNHPRTGDALVVTELAREAGCFIFALASAHLFHQGWFSACTLQAAGAFSIFREGVDKRAIDMAIKLLEEGKRPLAIFPEGATSRTNDQLHALLDGVSFIARNAAKRRARAEPPGKVVLHPVAIKYVFGGNLEHTIDPVLTDIEQRLSWRPQRELPLVDRIFKLGMALLSLKEIEYFGAPQTGKLAERLTGLINRLLHPLEQEWLGAPQEGGVVPRVKALRMKILPEMVKGEVSPQERDRRWRQLADIYLSQQVSCYPADYLIARPSVDRLLETVERFEEDLTDRARVHGQLKAIVEVGEAIEVSPERDRKAAVDPLMERLERELQSMLDRLALESPVYEGER